MNVNVWKRDSVWSVCVYLLCWQEVDLQQLPLTVHQRQEGHGDVVVSVEVGACAAIIVAVAFHANQSREVTPRVTESDGTLPAEALFP